MMDLAAAERSIIRLNERVIELAQQMTGIARLARMPTGAASNGSGVGTPFSLDPRPMMPSSMRDPNRSGSGGNQTYQPSFAKREAVGPLYRLRKDA